MKHETPLLRLRKDLLALQESLAFWEAQPPLELGGFSHEVRSSQIGAIKAVISHTEQDIWFLEQDGA